MFLMYSKFTLRDAEFCSINLTRETIRREILLYGFWNFKFKACGLWLTQKRLAGCAARSFTV